MARQQVAFLKECRKIKGFGSLREDFYTKFKPIFESLAVTWLDYLNRSENDQARTDGKFIKGEKAISRCWRTVWGCLLNLLETVSCSC